MTSVVLTILFSILLVGCYLRFARLRQIVDIPNDRSSHSTPTPHGGGVALFTAFILGLVLSAWLYGGWGESYTLLVVAAVLLMALGIIDDLWRLSVRLRLGLYSLVCLLIAVTLLRDGMTESPVLAWTLMPLAALIMLWSLNLFNFMDGIDGLVALQTILACGCAALLSSGAGHEEHYAQFCLILAAAHGGFLVWNWPPAKLFMGDAGSIPTGFLLAALAILGGVQGQLNPLCWLILLAVFVADASWTLMWRIRTGQAFTQPHRLHAYQRLSRYWGSHLKVDLLLVVITLVWLLPFAWAAQLWPQYSPILVILAYLPLLWGIAEIGRLE